MKFTDSLRVMLRIAGKDLLVIFKDTGLLFILLVLPMASAIMNSLINQRVDQSRQGSQLFPVALVNFDQGEYGRQIEKTLADIDVLKITRLDSVDTARQQVKDSAVLAAVLIPADLSNRINAYQPSTIEVVTDPTQKQFASLITGIMKEVVSPAVIRGEVSYAIRSLLSEYPAYQQADEGARQAYEAQNVAVQMSQVMKMQTAPWISVEAKSQSGAGLVKIPENMFTLMAPSFTVLFAFFTVGAMAAELHKEKKEGTMRRLIGAPIRPWHILAGKMLAYVALVIIQVGLVFGISSLAFDMPLGNSLPGLTLVTVAMGLAATGIGLLVASLAKTEKQADHTGLLMGFILGGLGGCFLMGTPVPLYKAGGAMETISKFTPQMHALKGFDILLNEGGGFLQVAPEALILLGFAALGLVIAAWRFRYE